VLVSNQPSSNNQGISWSKGPSGAGEVCAKAVFARLTAANQGTNVFLPDSKWMGHSQQDSNAPRAYLACRAVSD